jgi:RimJ/RimL family protein N-acetyltransferase
MSNFESKKYLLEQIDGETKLDKNLCETWTSSLLLYSDINILYSFDNFLNFCTKKDNKVFLIKDRDQNSIIYGIIGLRFIDLIQKKAELVIIMDENTKKKKLFYEPLKIILKKVFEDWNFRILTTSLYKDDVFTPTMLKGFGFQSAGTFKEYIQNKDEFCDVDMYYIVNKNFHIVDI